MQTKNKKIQTLLKRLEEASHLSSAIGSLHWDTEIMMPKKAADLRAQHIAYLSGLHQEKFLAINKDGLVTSLLRPASLKKLRPDEIVIVRETARDLEQLSKIPKSFVEELAKESSLAHNSWQEAREKSDFKIFLPSLKRMVALQRRLAKYLGYKQSPYDALLDIYEPGMTSEELEIIFSELRDFLPKFLQQIKKSEVKINPRILLGNFEQQKQKAFNTLIAKQMDFDFDAGRFDESTHPVTMSTSPLDVRIMTRYAQNDIFYALFSTIHEAGHALYEQGLKHEDYANPLGTSISVGVHESQSKIWENLIGRSRAFWKYFYPKLQKEFPKPFAKIDFELFYKSIHQVKPSYIRVEADEVTYNLHILMRFEIEKALIEGSIEVEDLPKIWNEKFYEYFGLKVPNDSLGVLQDVHWSGGSFGYFPTYTIGNLYSAQLYAQAKKDILNLEKEISKGHLEHIREWLRKKIHAHGKRYTSKGVIQKVTKEPLNSKYFIDYIKEKYSDIYEL